MFWFFGPKARGILAPLPGIDPVPPALEGDVLTTGPPGKSLDYLFFFNSYFIYLFIYLFWLCWVFGSCEGFL